MICIFLFDFVPLHVLSKKDVHDLNTIGNNFKGFYSDINISFDNFPNVFEKTVKQ